MAEKTQIAGKGMIFIVGASRSGTHMMSRILNQHPNVFVSLETHYFDDLRPKLSSESLGALTAEQQRRCEDYFLALGHRVYGLQGDPEKSKFSRDELRTLATELGADADAYFEAFCRLKARHAGRQICGEKTPRHIFRIREILEKFPEAHIICMVRDPRAIVVSYRDWKKKEKKLDFEHDLEYKLARDRHDDRARKSYNILLLSMLWRSTVNATVAAQKQFGSQRVYIQRYEDLVGAPETQVQNLASWLGLDYHAEMLEIPMYNSSFSQIQQSSKGLSTESVRRWRQKLSDAEIGIVQACCGRMLADAGYEREPVHTPYVLLAWRWVTLPLAVVQAAAVNHKRIGNLPDYIWRRLQGFSILRNFRAILLKNPAR